MYYRQWLCIKANTGSRLILYVNNQSENRRSQRWHLGPWVPRELEFFLWTDGPVHQFFCILLHSNLVKENNTDICHSIQFKNGHSCFNWIQEEKQTLMSLFESHNEIWLRLSVVIILLSILTKERSNASTCDTMFCISIPHEMTSATLRQP